MCRVTAPKDSDQTVWVKIVQRRDRVLSVYDLVYAQQATVTIKRVSALIAQWINSDDVGVSAVIMVNTPVAHPVGLCSTTIKCVEFGCVRYHLGTDERTPGIVFRICTIHANRISIQIVLGVSARDGDRD